MTLRNINYPTVPNGPDSIGNLSVSGNGSGSARISWTTPDDVARFHVVWSTLPITANYTWSASSRAARRPATVLAVGCLPLGPTPYIQALTSASVQQAGSQTLRSCAIRRR